MTDKETMELAESVGLIGPASRTHDLHDAIQRFHDLICANATIKAAVAFSRTLEAKDEPVAWRAWVSKFPQGTGSDWVYVTKPIMKDSVHNQPLYTTPPQRTWVELTDKEMEAAIPFGNLSGEYSYDDILNIILLIQAKLRSKND
jgi:hypothetical protein